jgi:hypothetical protein
MITRPMEIIRLKKVSTQSSLNFKILQKLLKKSRKILMNKFVEIARIL